MATHVITGGAGFVGVNLAAALLERGNVVIAVDDLSRGMMSNIEHLFSNKSFSFVQADCSKSKSLNDIFSNHKVDAVWHMAANSDISAGVENPSIDLEKTFLTTFYILEAMREFGVGKLNFASSSAIYGDFGDEVIYEDIGPLEPISNYGAMKLASEAQIRAAVESYLPEANIFRFPNVIGTPATHGVIWDFCRKLKDTPDTLNVLGNGTQQKAYLHVDDLVAAMLHIDGLEGRYKVYNIGPKDDGVTVRFIAEAVRNRANPDAQIAYGTDSRGWVGDVPKFRYSVEKLLSTGWAPTYTSEEAVVRSVDQIVIQELER